MLLSEASRRCVFHQISSQSSKCYRTIIINATQQSANGRRVIVTPQYHYRRRHFAEMPVPQSSQAQLFQNHPIREGWETTMMLWYTSSLALLVAILGYTPNTDIEAWAREEALLRLDAAKDGQAAVQFGQLLVPSGGGYYTGRAAPVMDDSIPERWEKFAKRAVRWNVDDEEDEEEDEEGDEDVEKEADQKDKDENVEAETLREEDTDSSVFVSNDELSIVQVSELPGLWRRISNVFSSLPEVQEEQQSSNAEDDDDDW